MDILADNVSHVSPCHPYRDMKEGESEVDYVARLAQELEDEFQRVGPGNVCAFIVEPMVGTVSMTPSRLDAFSDAFDTHAVVGRNPRRLAV